MATVTIAESPLVLRYGPRDAGIPLTLDEFEAADYVPGHRYELINGVLVVSPIPLEEERDANEELGSWLRTYGHTHPQGDALNLTLPEHNLRTKTNNRRADRCIWCGLDRLPRTKGRVKARDVPAIVVEFPSSRPADQRRDYDEKRVEYRDLGVKECWIIDRFRRKMTVYSWHGKRWAKREYADAAAYTTDLLPGFDLPLGDLFAISDRYAGMPPEDDA
jgi:Uma2 family endonuclease